MICVYDYGNTNYAGNGDAVLTPLECSHTQVAAGKYDLTLRHPMDPEGKWRHLVPEEAIIKAPIQEETIETAVSGLDVDLYQTTAAAALRSGPSEPTTINYDSWTAGSSYAVGKKVTDTSVSKNYQLMALLEGNEIYAAPHSLSSKWRNIARKTSGSPVIVNLKSGAQLYFIEASSTTGWYKMMTTYGIEGYIKTSQIAFVKHLTPEETQPRVIRNQLFRVRTVNVDTKSRTVTATAEHVSYDLTGVIVRDVKIAQMNPATALAWIEDAFMIPYQGTISTNMTSDTDGTYSGEINGKNGIYALLDPDKGIVASFDAMYQRDNWDVFVMRKTHTDRGFRLRYGKNILGVSWNKNSTGLINRVVPVAKDADGSDLYLENTEWVDSPLIAQQPVIRMERIKVNGQVGKDDGTGTATNWTAATLRAEMQKQAEYRFSMDKVDQVIHDVTIDFEMLGDTEEYKALKGLEQALMYDTVIAIDEQIGLSVSMEVTEIEYDCIREKVRSLKLSNVNGYQLRSVSGSNIYNNSITGDKLTDDAIDAIIGLIQ